MKLLHVLRSKPNDEVKHLIRILSEGKESRVFELYRADTNYDELIDLVFEYDKVVTWW